MMNHSDAKDFIRGLFVQNNVTNDTEKHSLTIDIDDDVIIQYPGKKYPNCNFDFRVDFNIINENICFTHEEIAEMVLEYRHNHELKDIISDLNNIFHEEKGGDTCCEVFSEKIKNLIFWVSVQEDLNYPSNFGRKMCFHKYFERLFLSKEQIFNKNIDDDEHIGRKKKIENILRQEGIDINDIIFYNLTKMPYDYHQYI